jgi:hypothetical protein
MIIDYLDKNSMDRREGACLASNIAARWSTTKHLMSRGCVLKYKNELGEWD